MKVRLRRKLYRPIHAEPGDTLRLIANESVLLHDEIRRKITITEVATFDVESGDFEGVKGGIGGAFLDTGEIEAKA